MEAYPHPGLQKSPKEEHHRPPILKIIFFSQFTLQMGIRIILIMNPYNFFIAFPYVNCKSAEENFNSWSYIIKAWKNK